MALPPIDILGVVAAERFAAGAGIDRLAVDAGRVARAPGLVLLADLRAQGVMDLLQGAVLAPLLEVAPDGALGREVHGQEAPLAAGPQDVKDGVQDIAHRGLAGPASGIHGDQRLDQRPLRVAEVAGIFLGSHTLMIA
jgi:hypothetical protein